MVLVEGEEARITVPGASDHVRYNIFFVGEDEQSALMSRAGVAAAARQIQPNPTPGKPQTASAMFDTTNMVGAPVGAFQAPLPPPPPPAMCGDKGYMTWYTNLTTPSKLTLSTGIFTGIDAGNGTGAVTDAECGPGYVYAWRNDSEYCEGQTCDVGNNPFDFETCCTPFRNATKGLTNSSKAMIRATAVLGGAIRVVAAIVSGVAGGSGGLTGPLARLQILQLVGSSDVVAQTGKGGYGEAMQALGFVNLRTESPLRGVDLCPGYANMTRATKAKQAVLLDTLFWTMLSVFLMLLLHVSVVGALLCLEKRHLPRRHRSHTSHPPPLLKSLHGPSEMVSLGALICFKTVRYSP